MKNLVMQFNELTWNNLQNTISIVPVASKLTSCHKNLFVNSFAYSG